LNLVLEKKILGSVVAKKKLHYGLLVVMKTSFYFVVVN